MSSAPSPQPTSQNAQILPRQASLSSSSIPSDDTPTPQILSPDRHPFKPLFYLNHKDRSATTRDPDFTVPRAGYRRHSHTDLDFWFSRDDNGNMGSVSFSEHLFCEGYDITAIQFYVVRFELMRMLFKNDLYKLLRKMNNKTVPETYAHYDQVEQRISEHPLLNNPRVHAYWKRPMIKEFVSRTASLMRKKMTPVLDSHESTVIEEIFLPNRVSLKTNWKWGPAVKSELRKKQPYAKLESVSIEIRLLPDQGEPPSLIPLRDIIPHDESKPELSLDKADYKLLVKEIAKLDTTTDEDKYCIAYQNMFVGNALLLIEDDHTLYIALDTLRVRPKKLLPLFVSTVGPQYEENLSLILSL